MVFEVKRSRPRDTMFRAGEVSPASTKRRWVDISARWWRHDSRCLHKLFAKGQGDRGRRLSRAGAQFRAGLDRAPLHSPRAERAEFIPAAIEQAGAFVLIFSSSANTSEYISRELDHAVTKRKPIIPVRLENIQPSGSVGFYVATSQWLDAFPPPIEPHLANLIKTTRRSLGVRAPSAKVVVAPSSKARSPESARPAISALLTATSSEAPAREFPTAGHWLAGIASFVAVAALGIFLVVTNGGDDPAPKPVPPGPKRVTQVNSQVGEKDCAASNWACSEDAEIEDFSLPGMDEVNGMPRVLSASALMIRSRRVELANIGKATQILPGS